MTKAPGKSRSQNDARQPARDTRTGQRHRRPHPEGLLHEGIFRIALQQPQALR